ncbi:MAG: glycosyltransferase family 4 protein [Bacteroidales bacterium]|nr:glycosyltransferase family 4 protein [Bacteroidales bacterium]
MKNKILFLLKTPPPITGATLMNKRVCVSKYLNHEHDIHTIEISYNKTVSGFGKLNPLKAIKFIKILFSLIYQLLRYRPHLVYFQISPTGISFLRDTIFVILIKLFRIKLAFHLRGKGIKNKIKNNSILRNYYKWIFKNISVICLSELLTYDIADIFTGTPFVVYNGMPEFNFICEKKTEKKVNILYLSNLIKEKGVLDYIDTLSILNTKGFDFTGTIVGEESDITKEYLLHYISKKGLSNRIVYRGSKYNDDKFKEYCTADIFLFPTYYSVEAFPGVVLEAMQFGLPVIATNEASIPIIIDDNKTGFLVDPKSPSQIAEKLEMLINNPNLRKEMGERGKEKFFKNFTFEIFEKNLSSTFDKILKK